jgi:hypothetical protein
MNTYHVYFGKGRSEVLSGNSFAESFLKLYKPIHLKSLCGVVKNELAFTLGKTEKLSDSDLETLHGLILTRELIKEYSDYSERMKTLGKGFLPIVGNGFLPKDILTFLDNQINEF